jgi:excisionase family DNA binding protein
MIHSPLITFPPAIEFLTTTEVATLLNLAPGTLADWRWKGGGPPFTKVGRHVRYNKALLLAWLDVRTRRNTSEQWPDMTPPSTTDNGTALRMKGQRGRGRSKA